MVFVSPEIHGREFEKAWKYFRKISIETHTKYGICTDKPFELREFFNE
jgi:hypothetical protein